MERAQNASWLCDPFRDDGFFFMDDDRCGLMVCVSEPNNNNKKLNPSLYAVMCFWMCGPLKKKVQAL